MNEKRKEPSMEKAVIYYLVCQFFIRGLAFISVPFFSRILNKSDFGMVSNFRAWAELLIPIVTLNLRDSINKSKYSFSEDKRSFLLSVITVGNIVITLVYIVVEFKKNAFENLFGMNIKYIRIMFLYLIFVSIYDLVKIHLNIYRNYRAYTLYSMIIESCTVLCSVVLVLLMQDKLSARIYGLILPIAIINFFVYCYLWIKGKKINKAYIIYALKISIPLIPSALSATILSSSDRAMITRFCGFDQTALYQIGYSVASIASIIWVAMNSAFGPWLFDHLDKGDFNYIKKPLKKYVTCYSILILGISFFVPEVLWIMGGSDYYIALKVIPAVIAAMVLQFFYAFYFDIEYFYGETYLISVGTLLAAVINFVLNVCFIPKYGYIAAAYTTFVGYFIMLIYHFLLVKYKLKKNNIFPTKYFVTVLIFLLSAQGLMMFLYMHAIVRYLLISAYMIFVCSYAWKNRNMILDKLQIRSRTR